MSDEPVRAADDFAAIKRRMRELAIEELTPDVLFENDMIVQNHYSYSDDLPTCTITVKQISTPVYLIATSWPTKV